MDYESLRRQYPQFVFEGFDIVYPPRSMEITYHFHIPGLCDFTPHWVFPLRRTAGEAERAEWQGLAFSLGMAELISYWKAVCSPEVVVRAGSLDDRQAAWWQNLFYHGLGEFYHVNGIPRRREDMPRFTGMAAPSSPSVQDAPPFPGALIPVGGGKDSLVTLTHCPETESDCFFVNPKPSALAGAELAGFSEERRLVAKRKLDGRLLELNRRGFLNGHTPFSALLAFASVLCAALNGRGEVVLSNEQSANEPTVTSGANHQYSKSFDFERDFSAYLREYHTKRVHYHSFLRPVSELQIAALFAALPRFHSVFRSCNRGSREDIWCGDCPKCLFVSIILSPFLSPAALRDIFGAELWENRALSEDFDGLTGFREAKPFECVGSRDEVNAALHLCLQRYYAEGEPPYLLRRYMEQGLYEPRKDAAAPYRSFYCTEHQLPAAYDAALRKALEGVSL